jgi:hypothetical protein
MITIIFIEFQCVKPDRALNASLPLICVDMRQNPDRGRGDSTSKRVSHSFLHGASMIESCAQIEHKAATDHGQFQHSGDDIQMENRPLLKLSTCQMHQVNRLIPPQLLRLSRSRQNCPDPSSPALPLELTYNLYDSERPPKELGCQQSRMGF